MEPFARMKGSRWPTAIRILHLADVINRYDFIDNVLRYCDRGRFRMHACTFTDRSNIEAPVYTDVPHYVLGIRGRRSYLCAIAKVATLLRRERIDIVHTHHFDPAGIGVAAAGLTGRRAIIGRHYSDNLHRLGNPWKRRAYLKVEAFFYHHAAKIIVPSSRVYDLLTRVQRVNAHKVVQIPYGFDLAKYVPSRDAPSRLRQQFAPNGEALVGCFGRLHREKGQVYLLRAARAVLSTHPHLRILLVGDGPDRPALEAAARELDLGAHVVFAGWRRDVVDLLAAVDIVVQPSVLGEGFSQAMVEALMLGKALVMSDVSGARDAIDHGRNGLLVSPMDADAIAAAVRALLDSPSLARQLGEAGREFVRHTLDIRSVIRRYEECYEAVYTESRSAIN